ETGSELAASLLEARQIRELKPPYNRQGRGLPRVGFLKLGVRARFPRLWTTQRLAADHATYLGPFASLAAAERALSVLGRLFKLRTCAGRLHPAPDFTPCLSGQVGACTAPCAARVDEAAYRAQVAAWLRDRSAHEGIILPLDGPDAIIERLDELTVTVQDLRMAGVGPLPSIEAFGGPA